MFRALSAHLQEDKLYTYSIWYCHSLGEFVVACRYTASSVYRQASTNSCREWQYHMLHVYNYILLKMSTRGCGDRDHLSRCYKYSLILHSITALIMKMLSSKYIHIMLDSDIMYKSPVVHHHCLLRCQFCSVECTKQCRIAYCGFQFLCSFEGLILRLSMSVIRLTISCTCL